MKKICGVYRIENTATGDFYIGSSIHCFSRWSAHRSALKRGCHFNRNLQEAYDSHGPDIFKYSMIEDVSDPTMTREREQHWLDTLGPTYNISIDAKISYPENISEVRSNAARKLWADPEYRKKAVAVRIGHAWNKGYKCTPEQKANRQRASRISNAKRQRALICTTTDTIYANAQIAAISLGILASAVCLVAKGRRRHTGGYHFVYAAPNEGEPVQ